VEERLYGEQLHVPWLIQFPGGHGRLARSAALTSHVDLLPTIVQWIGEDRQRDVAKFDGINLLPLTSAAKANWRDALFAMSRPAGSSAIRTANWCLLQHNAADHSGRRSTTGASDAELYVRPDDRWEANDVAKICPDIVEQLARASDSLALQITRGLPLPATVLSDLAPADVS
jgi:arylsulfatase A-like enzyme